VSKKPLKKSSSPTKKRATRVVRTFRRISDEEQLAILRRLENLREDMRTAYDITDEMTEEMDALILSLGGPEER